MQFSILYKLFYPDPMWVKMLSPKIVPDCRNKWCKPKMYLEVLLVQINVDSYFLSFAFMKHMGTELQRINSYVGKLHFQQF